MPNLNKTNDRKAKVTKSNASQIVVPFSNLNISRSIWNFENILSVLDAACHEEVVVSPFTSIVVSRYI